MRLRNSAYRVLKFVKDSLDILSGGKSSMRRNDVFFAKSGNDSHLVTSWRFSLQSKLGARPHSAAIVYVQTETENFQIHSLHRVESPQVLSYLSTRRYGFANNRARVSDIEFKPSVTHFLFVPNNIIPISFSLSLFFLSFALSHPLSFAFPFHSYIVYT